MTHGETRGRKQTTEWRSWVGMKDRCLNPNFRDYHHYGGRGITICPRWVESYVNFLADMGRKPSPEHSLDRIENDKGYFKENCRWATKMEQASNQRSNTFLVVNGVRKILAEWARASGLTSRAIRGRIKLGWSPEDTVFKPSRSRNKSKRGAP